MSILFHVFLKAYISLEQAHNIYIAGGLYQVRITNISQDQFWKHGILQGTLFSALRHLFSLPPHEQLEQGDAVLVSQGFVNLSVDVDRHFVFVLLAQVLEKEVAESPVGLVAGGATDAQLLNYEPCNEIVKCSFSYVTNW